jgi:hypothetical protein
MDCMASNAATKNGLVLSSRPPQAESWNGRCSCDRPNVSLIWRQSLIAKTGSTFDRKSLLMILATRCSTLFVPTARA